MNSKNNTGKLKFKKVRVANINQAGGQRNPYTGDTMEGPVYPTCGSFGSSTEDVETL